MYAIVETGGKQYRVRPGDTIEVERLEAEAGDTVELGRVLLVAGDDGDAQVGKPVLAGTTVVAEVVDQTKGDKIVVFKYKPKVRYRRKTGHRQQVTLLRIKEIQAESKTAQGKKAQSKKEE